MYFSLRVLCLIWRTVGHLLVWVEVCIFPTWWFQYLGCIIVTLSIVYVCRFVVFSCVPIILFYVCVLMCGRAVWGGFLGSYLGSGCISLI